MSEEQIKNSVEHLEVNGIIGVKAGMTHVFDQEGKRFAVTAVSIPENWITRKKAKVKDGVSSVQVGILPKLEKSTTRPERGQYKKLNQSGFKVVKEFRVEEEVSEDQVGKMLGIGFLTTGAIVDVTGTSIGKGFQGVMKKYNFAGGPKSHGASRVHRAAGSIGNRADPAKVFRNKKMAGQMGRVKVTTQNLEVFAVDFENQLVLIKGSVPGPNHGVVTIRKAVKG